MAGLRLVQVAVRAVTGLVLHLDGGVANLIVMFEKVLDALKQAIMVMGRDHLDVQCHDRFLTHQPDVNMMHIAHFGHGTTQVAFKLGNVHGCRRPFKQFIHALLQQPPGTAQYQTRYQHGQNRVDGRPAGIKDHQRGHNSADGTQ